MNHDICMQTKDNFIKLTKNKKIVFWGAVSKNVNSAILEYGKPECIIDSDSEKWGLRCENVEIFPPEHLYALNPEAYVILVTAGNKSAYPITNAIKSVDSYSIFYYGVLSNQFLGLFSKTLYENLDSIKQVEELLDDDMSKKIYRECIRRRIIGATGDYKDLKIPQEPQYLYGKMYKNIGERDEVFVDCGGYIGDSVEKFVKAFGNDINKIYSFECFKDNVYKIRETGERLQADGWEGELIVESYAVSDKNGVTIFNDIGKSEGGYLPETRLTLKYNEKLAPIETHTVDTIRLDDYIGAKDNVSLIKMDIEGAEYAALIGAEQIIKRCEPRLAISIYHNPQDYWRICKLIHKFSNDYRFAVRHHQNNHLDTVLYAWKEK